MKTRVYHPLLHRFAVLTMVLALLPIIVGALVTTLNAGMAFRDWPSSDGHNMFFYPWLKSAGDKFIEHGHRLAGALIGFVSIGLAVVAGKLERRKSVRFACYAVLIAVCIQGALGGGRVRLDARTLAMVHGSFAALVFVLMTSVAVMTSRSWIESKRSTEASRTTSPVLHRLTDLAVVAIFLQYLMGGLVRHLGMALHEHLGGAVFVSLIVTAAAVAAHFSRVPKLRRTGWWMFAFLVFQISLGLATWVTKFGFTPTGYVAVAESVPQIVLRTAHTVSGMMLLAAAVTLKLKAFKEIAEAAPLTAEPTTAPAMSRAGLTWEGGLR